MKVTFQPNNKSYILNTNFKSNITIDIGGSQREGSRKTRYSASNTDEVFYTDKSYVNEVGKNGFENEEDFINLIVNKIKKVQIASKGVVKEKGYKEDENIIRNVAIFLPSYTDGDKVFYFPNLRNYENKPLKDIDFSHFKERLSAEGIKVSDEMQFKVVQDAMGTGLAMTKKLYEEGMLKVGNLYTACITGGGCAISNIEVPDKEFVIIKSSGSSYLSESLSLQKVSKAGASAPAIIENFCRALGLNEEIINDIKSCHKAEFALSDTVRYVKDMKTEKLKNILAETGRFEVTEEDNESFVLKIKNEYANKYSMARRNAIDKYCLALARLAIIKKTEGSNGMIVTGALAKAVNLAAEQNYGVGVANWITQHLEQSFNSYELNKLQEVYNFRVFCDSRFFIDNNTECGDLIHKAKFISPKRSNWLKLDIKNIVKPSVIKKSFVI